MVVINSIDVTDDQINSLIKKMRNWGMDRIDWSKFDKFEFQGFTPEKTVASLISTKLKMNLVDDAFHDDIITMVGIGIMKGNVTTKSKNRMSPEGKAEFEVLEKRYGIAEKAMGKASTVITIPRMVSAYAGLAVRMVSKLGPKKYPGKSFKSEFLPPPLQLSCFPSVIPKSLNKEIKEFLMIAALGYSMDLTITVKRIEDQNEITKQISEQRRFVDLAHNSSIPVENSRISLTEEIEIAKNYPLLLKTVQQYKLFVPDYKIPTQDQFNSAFTTLGKQPSTPDDVQPSTVIMD
jgi:hypothetical protein